MLTTIITDGSSLWVQLSVDDRRGAGDMRRVPEAVLHVNRADVVNAPRRAGRQLVTRCPLHDDTHPSLTVNVDTGLWFRLLCAVGGDAIRFVERLRGCSFADAVRAVAAC